MNSRRAIVAMSGGVDSSVSAYLLKEQGYDVVGITMQLWDQTCGTPGPGRCCSPSDVSDARSVASVLGIPFYVMNCEDDFRDRVVMDFIAEYERGRTPNPCIRCNERIKFARLMNRARELDAGILATGHYARIEKNGGAAPRLLAGLDRTKDQSYFLFTLDRALLERVAFPIGGLLKEDVRSLARSAGLPVADKRDSQEICFVPGGDLEEFFHRNAPGLPGRGTVVDRRGRTLGTHNGYYLYTIGQRHGLGVSSPHPLYVLETSPSDNTVMLGEEAELYRRSLLARPVHWISGEWPDSAEGLTARIRSRHDPSPCTVSPLDGGGLRVVFQDPQRAIAPGQAVVIYRDSEVLGGAWIDCAE